jgi:UPF0755 protein
MDFKRINLFLGGIIIVMVLGFFGYRHFSRPKYAPPAPRPEVTITIIPGWTLRQIAIYFENLGKFQQEEITEYVGLPAIDYRGGIKNAPKIDLDLKILKDKPAYVSYEGYLAPETYRVYKDAVVKDIVEKLLREREAQITPEMWSDIEKSGKSFFEILTMASLVEKEARTPEDMALVADIFWRRNKMHWALQSCATVNYVTGKSDPAVSAKDKEVNSPYNTYKYPGLPLGPIGNPSLKAINAALYPTKNDYWYFMSDPAGNMHYAKTLEEHNRNVAKYLR